MSAPLAAMTLGGVLRAADVGDLWLAEVDYPLDGAFPLHAHARGYVTLVLRGGFEERVGARRREVGSGGVVVMPAGVEHGERFGPAGGRSLLVTLPAGPEGTGSTTAVAGVFAPGPLPRAALALLRAFRGSAELAALPIEEHLAALLAAVGAAPEPDADGEGRLADRARDRLAAGFAGEPRLGSIATELGCTAAHLARAFRRRHGCTMGAWLRRRRVDAAARQLAGSRAPLAEIAADCGFADQSHLTRVFRAAMGVTPGEFRRLTAH